MTAEVDPTWRGLYRAGGVFAIVYGLLLFTALAFLFVMGPPPTGAQAFLNYYAGRGVLARLAFGLFGLSDLTTVPVVLAVYQALRGINKDAMLVASGFFGLFIVLDLGVNVLNNLSMISLAESYVAASGTAQGAAYVATADYTLATLSVSGPIFGFVVPSTWGLITSLVMLRSLRQAHRLSGDGRVNHGDRQRHEYRRTVHGCAADILPRSHRSLVSTSGLPALQSRQEVVSLRRGGVSARAERMCVRRMDSC